jgi:MFS family permease
VTRLTIRQQITLSLLWFSLNFETAALLPVVIPAQLLLFVAPGAVGSAQQAVALGWLSAFGAVIALIAQPLTGAASDRSRFRLGRRRPYVLIAGGIYVVGLAALAWSATFAIFIIGFVLAQVAANVGTAAYQGLLPDRVPADQRGAASGFLGMMTLLGNAASLIAAGLLLGNVAPGAGLDLLVRSGTAVYYVIGIAVLVVGTLVTVIGVSEKPTSELRRSESNFLEVWLSPLRHHNFRWVFITRVSVMIGLTLFLTFIEYYFAEVLHVRSFIGSTVAVALLALAGGVIGAVTLGMVSDRIGRVGIVAVATGLMTVAALAFVIAPSVPLWPLGLVFGAGFGAYTSVDWALVVDSLPILSAAGKDMGVWSIASNLPAVLAPALGSVVIGGASALGISAAAAYRSVFALAGIFLLLGALFVFRVQESRQVTVAKIN